MATGTATAVHANRGGHQGHNRIAGKYTNNTGAKQTALTVLLAELPYGAKNIHLGWSAVHTTETGAKVAFGYSRNGSVTASALVAVTDIGVTTRTTWAHSNLVTSPAAWSSVTGGAHYVTCTLQSGTAGADFTIDYVLTYDMYDL